MEDSNNEDLKKFLKRFSNLTEQDLSKSIRVTKKKRIGDIEYEYEMILVYSDE